MNDLERAHYARQLAAVDKCSDQDIQHWKYIKKKKVNGKWRYYYDTESLKEDVKEAADKVKDGIKDKLGYDEKERMEEARRDLKEAEASRYKGAPAVLDTQMEYIRAKQAVSEAEHNIKSKELNGLEVTDKDKLALGKAKNELKSAEHDYNEAVRKDDKNHSNANWAHARKNIAEEAYADTPLAKIEGIQEKIETGKKAVSDWLEKLFKKRR